MVDQVKAGTDQVFNGGEDTRQKVNFSFLKMGGLPEHEGKSTRVDCTLISHFSARTGLVRSF
jgi:hypothetical protein